MKTYLSDLLDLDELTAAEANGLVRVQRHPDLELEIRNYSEQCVFARAWSPATLQCRGLISHAETGEVIARSFPKFFNYGEPDAPTIMPHDPVTVTDKMDGSLGILYPTGDGGRAIATRGSFASVQAQHATILWEQRYAGRFLPVPGFTYLFEIIYPSNRIVVDYRGLDDLVLLGAVDIATGESIDPCHVEPFWPGPNTETFAYETFAEALAADPRPGMEGFVVRRQGSEDRIKIKQEDYVSLHRVVTGMNERVVWEHLGTGKPIEELIEPLPDEFHVWVRGVAARLIDQREEIAGRAELMRDDIFDHLSRERPAWERKDFAEFAIAWGAELRPWLFNLLDGRDPRPGIWKTLRPSGAVTMTGYSEEAA